jgi:4-aminobutyrate aminotransferase-like enzyme
MTMTAGALSAQSEAELQQKAKDHLWMHFTRQSVLEEHGAPIIVRGQGHHIWDSHGKQYFDGLSGLFVVNAGHGRRRLAEVAARQAEELAFFPLWSYAHPSAIELADRLADYAPGDLNRVFFTTGGGGKHPPEFCTGSRNTAATVSGPSKLIISSMRFAAHCPNPSSVVPSYPASAAR